MKRRHVHTSQSTVQFWVIDTTTCDGMTSFLVSKRERMKMKSYVCAPSTPMHFHKEVWTFWCPNKNLVSKNYV